MGRYILKRIIQMIPILLIVAILIFLIMSFVPGDPVQIILGDQATELQIEEARENLGLNKPFAQRLVDYLLGVIRLDFGKSYLLGTNVSSELLTRFPRTLLIALLCICFTVVFGIPIGIRCALKAGTPEDNAWLFFTLMLNSMPGFWLALMLVLLFSVKLGWLPSNGIGGWKYYVLPVLSNSLGSLASIARQTRASMLEVIRSDFVVTARSKGVSESNVTWHHALPNAMIPIVTILGARFGFLLGGTTITESVFSIPGIGLYMINGINNRDYPIVQGCVVYIAFSFSVMMLLTDLVYAFIDPRIKAQYAGPAKAKKKTA